MPEGLPLQQFHGDERSPISLVDFVNRTNVRVVQGGRSFGFPLKTAESLCVVGKLIRKELQGDMATQPQVFGLVHDSPAATADLG
jgi:hypothetical protein